ncbi:hypothetical protein AB5I41_07275 [Sphingomonas sp. MMS24-JH45]
MIVSWRGGRAGRRRRRSSPGTAVPAGHERRRTPSTPATSTRACAVPTRWRRRLPATAWRAGS